MDTSLLSDESLQSIYCEGSDTNLSFPVYSNNVLVKPSKLRDSNNASNKVKVSQISKFEWVEKYYLGNLVTCNANYIAYVLRAKSNLDDHVRVLNYHTSERVLLRGFKKNVVDVSFESFKSNKLACVDSQGSLFVFDINETDQKLASTVILEVSLNDEIVATSFRVIWAPNLLLPMEGHESIIALSSGNKASVFNLNKIQQVYPDKQTFSHIELSEGVIRVENCHEKDITCLALSPDTQVLATASEDGCVKFWSLNFNEQDFSPSCLHEWEPHDGKPVTCLFFCDNLLVGDDSSPFWRFLITGTDHNSVLNIWCAVKWECIQSIRFADYDDGSQSNSPCLKVALDISANYLIISDIYRPVLYICNLHQDLEKEKSSIVCLSEFILRNPLLSYSICVAKERKRHSSGDMDNELLNGDVDESLDAKDDSLDTKDDDKDSLKNHSFVSLFAIGKRALSKYSIKFKANTSIQIAPPSISTASQEDLSIKDALSDVDFTETHEQTNIHTTHLSKEEESFASKSSLTTVSPLLLNVTPPVKHDDDIEGKDDEQLSPPDKEETLIDISSPTDRSPTPTESISSSSQTILSETVSISLETPTTSFSSMQISQTIVNNDSSPLVNHVDTPKQLHDIPLDEKQANHTPVTTYEQASEQQVMNGYDKVVMMLEKQQEEIRELKDVIKTLVHRESQLPTVVQSMSNQNENAQNLENDREDMKVYMQLLQKSATSQFSKASKEFNKQCTQRLEQLSKDLQNHIQSHEERMLQQLSSIVSNTIAIRLEKTIKQEMKQTVLSTVDKIINKHLENMTNQIAQKLSVWERTLREETQELIKSKPLAESIGYAAASILEGTIPNAYRESFQNVLLPGFEKASMAMFMQINQTFQQGTKQYLERLESYLESKRQRTQDQQEPLISNLQDLVHSFQGTADRLTAGVETNLEALMQKQLRDATERMQSSFNKAIESKIIPSLSTDISKCTSEAFTEWKGKIDQTFANLMQQGATAGSSTTPQEDRESKQARVMKFIKTGEYNAAFEAALTASDLALVLYLCKQVDPTELFQQDECLPQPIILSLIQQLSVNLWEDTEIKRKYLEETFMALDVDDDITSEHLPGVLQSLNEQLCITIESLLRQDGSNKEIKPLKMLLMASKSLLHNDR